MRGFLVVLLVVVAGCVSPVSSPLVKVENQTKVVRENGDSVVSLKYGTGFFVNEYGVFVTAYHVIKGHNKVYVYLADRPLLARYARVLVVDEDVDLALLHVPRVRTKPLRFCTDAKAGQEVTAYAWRHSTTERTAGTLLGPIYGGRMITTLMVRSGFSGGPVYDEAARCVVGVTVQVRIEGPSEAYTVFVRPEGSEIMGRLRQLAPESVRGL